MHACSRGRLVALAMAFGFPALGGDLKTDGAFGFPQQKAKVFCDARELRVSAWNDAVHLYIQAVLWTDDDASSGETDDGRVIGDWSSLAMDLDADGKITPRVDRNYMLNPWPRLPGLHYSILLGGGGSTPIQSDTKGRGGIRYVDFEGRKVRVDSYLIPLAEIARKPGEKIRFAFWGSSEKPLLTVNSVGYEAKGRYYSYRLPLPRYHEWTLADHPASIDVKAVPTGSEGELPLAKKAVKPKPKIGAAPPEVFAKDWLNADRPATLAGLKGKVVLVEFWATWCGPCVAGIPHLNKLHEELGPKGLVVLSFSDQSRKGIEKFMKEKPMKYILGAGSELAAEYGVAGIPQAFIVGRDGKLLWSGNPGDDDFDRQVKAALDAK